MVTMLLLPSVATTKDFNEFDQDTTPATTDLLLKSAGGAGTTYMTFEHLFDLEDVIGKKSFEDEDWGDMSGSSNSVTLDADVVAPAEMADADHGFFTYSSGVASLDTGGLTSANLLGALTNETGTGVAVFGTSPTFTGNIYLDGNTNAIMQLKAADTYNVALNLYPDNLEENNDGWRIYVNDSGTFDIETYQSGSWVDAFTLTNAGTAYISTGIELGHATENTLSAASGVLSIEGGALAPVADPTFTGTVVLPNSQALVTPVLGTPTSGTLTSCTGLPTSTGLTDLLSAARTYTGTQTFPSLSLTELTSAPTPVGGDWYHPDYTNFNPSGSGVGIGYYTIYRLSDTTYVQNFDNNGNLHLAGIPSPAYAHITGADYPYFDTETPHVLTYTETHGGTITNTGATQDRVYTVSTAYDAEMAFVVMVRAAYQMDIEPYSGGKIWLCVADTCTEGGADVHIRNTDDTPGDSIACKGIELTDGVYELWCKTGNSGWELTP